MLPLHQRPAWLRVMIVRPMRLPDRGFITTEAGRDSNGSVFTECGNRQKYGTRALRWNRTCDPMLPKHVRYQTAPQSDIFDRTPWLTSYVRALLNAISSDSGTVLSSTTMLSA